LRLTAGAAFLTFFIGQKPVCKTVHLLKLELKL